MKKKTRLQQAADRLKADKNDDDAATMWRDYREAQAERRRKRVPKRIASLQAHLPEGFSAEEKNQGYAWLVTGPFGFRLTWYPTHQRAQWKGKWVTMFAENVGRLARRWLEEHAAGNTP